MTLSNGDVEPPSSDEPVRSTMLLKKKDASSDEMICNVVSSFSLKAVWRESSHDNETNGCCTALQAFNVARGRRSKFAALEARPGGMSSSLPPPASNTARKHFRSATDNCNPLHALRAASRGPHIVLQISFCWDSGISHAF